MEAAAKRLHEMGYEKVDYGSHLFVLMELPSASSPNVNLFMFGEQLYLFFISLIRFCFNTVTVS